MSEVASEENLAGTRVEDRYLIRRRIGEGAMGAVYAATSSPRARAAHGKSRVAIKVLLPEHAADPHAVSRFTHEAFLGARLGDAKRLVRTLDFGTLRDGRPWFAMELWRGLPLDRALARVGRFAAPEAARLVADAASALAALHRHGLVHRDVKPANLFLTASGKRPTLRLLDLGIVGIYDARRARTLGVEDACPHGSHGTPAYISPEQALALPLDPRADVYSLACVAYRMLTGLDPLRGKTPGATVRAHLFKTPRPASRLNPALSPRVDAVLARALEKERSLRQSSVLQFARALSDAVALH